MDGNERFADLKKIRADAKALALMTAGKILPISGAEVDEETGVADALAAFDATGSIEGIFDQLVLLSHALPPREAVWWACLAANDLYPEGRQVPKHLQAAEQWVRKPGEETRHAVEQALQSADMPDRSTGAAEAAVWAEGTMGTGVLSELQLKPGMFGTTVYSTALASLKTVDKAEKLGRGRLLVDRALDIARGGNGRVS